MHSGICITSPDSARIGADGCPIPNTMRRLAHCVWQWNCARLAHSSTKQRYLAARQELHRHGDIQASSVLITRRYTYTPLSIGQRELPRNGQVAQMLNLSVQVSRQGRAAFSERYTSPRRTASAAACARLDTWSLTKIS